MGLVQPYLQNSGPSGAARASTAEEADEEVETARRCGRENVSTEGKLSVRGAKISKCGRANHKHEAETFIWLFFTACHHELHHIERRVGA